MGGAPATEVFPGFRIRPVGDAGTPVRAIISIAHETGPSARVLSEKDTFVTFPELTPEAGGTWLLSLNALDYPGVDPQPVRWPVREKLVLKEADGDSPDITVEVESLQYRYEPGFEGPFVTYPARADGDGGPTA